MVRRVPLCWNLLDPKGFVRVERVVALDESSLVFSWRFQTIVNVVELVKTTTVNEDSFKGKAATTKGLEDANTESKGKAATAKGLEDANTESKAQRQLYAQYSSLQLKLDKVGTGS